MSFPPGFMVPVVQRIPTTGGARLVPTSLAREVSAGVRGHDQVDNLTHDYGRGHKPKKSIVLFNPDSKLLTVIVTDGGTEMAELQDLAHETIERNAERAKANGGSSFDFAGARQRAGLPPVSETANRFREHVEARIKRHRANPVTDPFRQPRYPKVNGRTSFVQGANESWQEQ